MNGASRQYMSNRILYSGSMPLAPGLHVFYANQVESLAAQLALDLALFRGEEGAWQSATLVVPNPNVKDYLRGAFAEAFGAVANLKFQYLEGFWAKHANRPLLDRATLFGSILAVLQDTETRRNGNLAPLTQYLTGPPEDLKAVQLSQRLAQHFERILLQRPDWIRSWDRGLPARGAAPAALEAWQRALWRRLRRAWKGLAQPPVPLMDWMDDPAFAAAPFPEAVFLFGMSHMAPVFHHALAQVGTRASVRLYLVNPCEEPWDLDPLQRPALDLAMDEPPEGDDPFSLHQDRSEVILQRWARPAREQLRLLAGLAQGDFLGRFQVPETPTALAHLQRRILAPERTPTGLPEGADASLRVVPCPTLRREAETVANLIWDLVQQSQGSLHFGDIGVLVPAAEQDAYEEHLGAAFRSAHDIPWVKALGTSRTLQELAEACLLLLDLGSGELSRADLLRAASHPFLQSRLGAAPEAWGLLCDQAGIVARLDAEETTGTYLDGGRWTWDEGLTRLALGRFMKDDEGVEELGPRGRPVGRAESSSLLALLGPLTADLRALAKGRFSLANWQERLELFLGTYLGPPAEATEPETEAFEKVRKALRKGLAQVDGLRTVVLDFQAMRPLVKASLEALLADNALSPGRGVQVSCYTPLRAIPFKALFLMSLGEGLFPATERPDPLDLVTSSPRRAGDVSRPEQERQLFLEAVLCAREHLICTYPSRSATTGDALQPSPLLMDLQETLGPDLWQQVCCKEQPLHRHDLSLFPELNPEPGRAATAPISCHSPAARHEAEARWLGLRLRQELGNRDLPRRIAAMGGTPELRNRLNELVGGCGPLGEAEPQWPSQMRITLKELRRWLECPIQGGVALRLGVKSLDESDLAELEDFPVDSSALDQWWLLRRSFWTGCAAQADFEPVYEQVRREKESQAKAPIGPLSQGERRRHLALLDRWAALVGGTDGLTLHRFGAGLPFETLGIPVQEQSALILGFDHPRGRTEIHLEGLTEPLRGDAFLLLSTRDCGKEGPRDKARLESLRAWLGHLALCALGASSQRFARLHSAPQKGSDSAWKLPLPPVAPDEAKAQLTSWCREILLDEEPKLLPIEALLSGKEIPDLRDWIQDQKDDEDRLTLTSFRGPVPRVKELPVDDLATGRRRLGAFLDLQAGWVQA
jgi:exodeoxyribonuclease V gamma subunit